MATNPETGMEVHRCYEENKPYYLLCSKKVANPTSSTFKESLDNEVLTFEKVFINIFIYILFYDILLI